MGAIKCQSKKILDLVYLVTALGYLCITASSFAKPRPMTPPWPSLGMIFHEGFDQPVWFPTNQAVDSTTWAESWSGWNLNRQSSVVTPWTVPMVVSNAFRVEPEQGAYRFWYRPDYDSGVGPGQPATLLTLVTIDQQTEVVWWSLVVTPDGSAVHLVCQTENGPQSCLQATVNWKAGSWHLLTIGFTPTNSTIFIDGQLETTGPGLATVPVEAAPLTHLVVGSNPSGTQTARGQMEELWIFSGRNRIQQIMGNSFGLSVGWEIGIYYASLSPLAARGPISEEELEARRARMEQIRAEREALGLSEGGGIEMMLLSSPAADCVTNLPLYITNIVSAFDSGSGWTVTFEVQGTNGPADIFATANLAESLTNSVWVWLERGPSCSVYQYTNQPTARAFYILGTAQDSDGDGMTDAYERLVSHTNPLVWNVADTDGDGMPDAWEVAHGLDPLVANGGGDPDADVLTNLQEYLGGTRPLVSEGFGVWVGQPQLSVNLP